MKKLTADIAKLKKNMKKASDQLEFEEAAKIRDEIKRLEVFQMQMLMGDVDKNFDETIEGKISS